MVITAQEMIERMERAVDERGADFVYPFNDPAWFYNNMCVYRLEDGAPGCIVGLALADVLPAQVSEGKSPFQLAPLTELANAVALRAQNSQDAGQTWGAALGVAKDALERNEYPELDDTHPLAFNG